VEENRLRVSARNRIVVGDYLEILDPQYPEVLRVRVNRIIAVETGDDLDAAHNGYQVDLCLAEKSAGLISRDAIIRNKSEV
jgi:hypothetical protein